MPVISRTTTTAILVMAALCAAVTATAQGVVSEQTQPIPLVQGGQVGKTQFTPGDTVRGGNGKTIDGIEGAGQEMLKTHTHSHLSLFYKGVQIAVPYGIGIIQPFQINSGFVEGGKGYYWLHTHDATGIVHVESPDNRAYTLGNFFDVWGQSLDAHGAAGLKGAVRVYINGKLALSPARSVPLRAHDQITVMIGTPLVTPPTYILPDGL